MKENSPWSRFYVRCVIVISWPAAEGLFVWSDHMIDWFGCWSVEMKWMIGAQRDCVCWPVAKTWLTEFQKIVCFIVIINDYIENSVIVVVVVMDGVLFVLFVLISVAVVFVAAIDICCCCLLLLLICVAHLFPEVSSRCWCAVVLECSAREIVKPFSCCWCCCCHCCCFHCCKSDCCYCQWLEVSVY